MSQNRDEFKQTARLSETARQEVLDRLDRSAGSERETLAAHRCNQRKDIRWAFRQCNVAVTVEHPAGGVSRLLLFSRNLSSGGISFVHNGFLYPQSRCKVMLPKVDGQSQAVNGTIVSCRHIQGLLHEIGLKFDRRIDPMQFLDSSTPPGNDSSESMELPELLGNVLMVESNEFDARLLQHYLKVSGITPTVAAASGVALDIVKQSDTEIVLCELNIEGCDGIELLQKLREAQFTGPIMVLTAETDNARVEQARQAGAEHVLAKPYDPNELLAKLIEMNQKIGTVLNRAALFSSVDDQPGMAELVVDYIGQVRQIARRIEQSIAQENLKELRQLCLNLKGSASGYGFATIGESATAAIQALDSGQTLKVIRPRLRTLATLCQRLRVRERVGATKAGERGISNAA